MIEDKTSPKERETCKDVKSRLLSYESKMMEAKQQNQFAVANMWKEEIIKCRLLLSEKKHRRDRLTKLLNRNAFDEDIYEFEKLCASNTPGGKGIIFAIDLMNFKLLNDKHGHAQGDRALRRFAAALRDIAKMMMEMSKR